MLEPHGGTADLIDSLCIGMMAVIDSRQEAQVRQEGGGDHGWHVAVLRRRRAARADHLQLTASQMSFQVMSAGMLAADSALEGGEGGRRRRRPRSKRRKKTNRVACSEIGARPRPQSSAQSALLLLLHSALARRLYCRRPQAARGAPSTSFAARCRSVTWQGSRCGPGARSSARSHPRWWPVSKAALDDPELAKDPVAARSRPAADTTYRARPMSMCRPTFTCRATDSARTSSPSPASTRSDPSMGVAAKTLSSLGLSARPSASARCLSAAPSALSPIARQSVRRRSARYRRSSSLSRRTRWWVSLATPRARTHCLRSSPLWPQLNCLWLLQIPFRDEMRRFDWGRRRACRPPPRS